METFYFIAQTDIFRDKFAKNKKQIGQDHNNDTERNGIRKRFEKGDLSTIKATDIEWQGSRRWPTQGSRRA